MPRRTPTAELQASEASVSSPLRRSSRISSNTTAHSSTPTAIVTRRSSQIEAENNAPAKITRSRRSSATDVEDKKETKPLTRTRRASLLAEDESKPEAKSTPTRRGRRGSVTETTESKPEEKPKPVRSRRSSASDQPTQPEKKPQTRGRRRSVDVEMETQESSQPPKPTTRRKKSPESENQSGEVNTEKETRPRRSRRVSTDGDMKSNTPSNSRLEKEDVRSMSKSPQVVETTLEGKNDEDLSPILMPHVTIKLTPIKKTRLLDKVEAELDLSVINESVDDINTSKLDSSDSKTNANDTRYLEKDAQHRSKSASPKDNVSKKRPSTSPDGNRTPRKSPRLMAKGSKDVTPSKGLKHSKKLSFSENITVIDNQDNKEITSEEQKLLNISGESSGSNKENVDVTTTGTQSITDSVLNSTSEFKLQSALHCEPCEPMDVDLSASEIAILENKQKDGKEDTDSIENYIIEETGNSVNISMKPKAKDSNFTRVFEKEIGNKESEILDKSLTEISIRHVTISTSLIQPRKESTTLSKSTSPIPGESYEEVVGLKQPDLQTTSTTLQNYSPEKQTTNKVFNSEAVTTNMSVEENVSERKELDLPLSPQKKVLDENITLQTEISKPITNLKHHLLNSALLDTQDFEKSISENNKSEISFNDSISSKELTDNKEKDVECTEDDVIRTKDVDELESSKNTLGLNQKKNETDRVSSSTIEVSTSPLQNIESQDKQEQEFHINQPVNEDLSIANKSIEKFSSTNASPKAQSPSSSERKKISLHNSDIQNSPKINERITSSTISAKTNESVPSESKESDLTHYDFNLPSEDDDVFANDSKLNDETNELSDEENEANYTQSRQEVSINKEPNSEDPNSDEQAMRSENDNNTNLEFEKSGKQASTDSDGVITPNDLVNEDKGIEKIKSNKQVIGSESDITDKDGSVQNTLNQNLEIQGFEKEKSDKRIITSEDDNSVLQEFEIRTKESSIEKDSSVKNTLNENMEVITPENIADEDKISNKYIISESDASINEDLDKSTDNPCEQRSINDDLSVKPETKTDEVTFSVREASRSDDSKNNVSNSDESNFVTTKPDNTKENDTLENDSDYSDQEVKENNPKTTSPHKQIEVSDSSKTPTLNIIENIVIHQATEEPENAEAKILVKDEKEQTTTPSQDVQSVSDGKEYKSKKSSLQAFDNKLDSYIKSQLDADSSSDEEKVEVNDFIDDMAEEGEEDTPSEDSNQIIDEGESVGFSESDERSSEDEYEEDSFICDDEEGNELLSGNEYDLDEPNQVKKSRIISPSNLPDDEIIQIPGKKKEPVKRKSRIIRVSSSSSDEGNAEVFETKNVPNKRIEQLKKTESVRSTSSGSSVIILDSSVNESSKAVSTEDSQLVSDSGDEKQPIGEEVEQQTPAKKSTETPVKADKLLQSRPRKSSLTIQENIIVDGSVELGISRRINSLVDSFCSSVSKGEIAVNISLEYEDTKNDNLPKETEVKNVEEDSIILSSQTNSDSDDLHDVETPESKPQASTSLDNVQDLRDVLNEKARKRRLSKSMDDLTKNTKPNKKRKLVKKAKKEKKPKKKQSENQTRDPIASSFSLFNQLITDVKNRPRRKIKPSQSNTDVITSWNASAIEDLKPSTSPASKKEKMKPSTLGFHPKDFRNRMLCENSRVNRINTKTLLKKKGAFS